MAVVRPASPEDAAAAIQAALRQGEKLEIRGGGTKADVGAPTTGAGVLEVSGIRGVVDYTPAELVLTVRAGTPLAEVEELLVAHGQMLAFEPFDYAPILGAEGCGTIGGLVAAAAAGSRRLGRGGVRDHLLGFAAVTGRGEQIVGGGKVVKNVTGYDLPKLMAGSWGRLAVLTEVTFKVLPAPRDTRTLVVRGLSAAAACQAMASALGSNADVAAAAHQPARGGEGAVTLFRLEGFAPSVAARTARLASVLAPYGEAEVFDPAQAAQAWKRIARVEALAGRPVLWRVSIPGKAMPQLAARVDAEGGAWLADWGGGLLWLGFEADPGWVRDAAAAAGGHANLVRAPASLRRTVPAFHPQAKAVAELELRVRKSFDPAGVFETGRF